MGGAGAARRVGRIDSQRVCRGDRALCRDPAGAAVLEKSCSADGDSHREPGILVLLLGANLLLANAAHLGGHLVHLYGVRAQLGLDEPLSEVEDESAEDASAEEPLEDSTAESSDAAMSEVTGWGSGGRACFQRGRD